MAKVAGISVGMSVELLNRDALKIFFKELPEKQTKIMSYALNQAANSVRKTARGLVPRVWNIDKKELKDFKIKRATAKKLASYAVLSGKRIPLSRLKGVISPQSPKDTSGFWQDGRLKRKMQENKRSVVFRIHKRVELSHVFVQDLGKRGAGVYETLLRKGAKRGQDANSKSDYMKKYQTYWKEVANKDGINIQQEPKVRTVTTASAPHMWFSELTEDRVLEPTVKAAENSFARYFKRKTLEELTMKSHQKHGSSHSIGKLSGRWS
jgi:hypothetical protein